VRFTVSGSPAALSATRGSEGEGFGLSTDPPPKFSRHWVELEHGRGQGTRVGDFFPRGRYRRGVERNRTTFFHTPRTVRTPLIIPM